MIDAQAVRDRTLSVLKSLGIGQAVPLPLLEDELRITRSLDEVVDRSLCLHVVSAYSYGCPREMAATWLQREGLTNALSPKESGLLLSEDSGEAGAAECFKIRVQCLWALTWVLGFREKLDLTTECADTLRSEFPKLSKDTSAAFRERASLKSIDEVAPVLDLAYCMHWFVAQASLFKEKLPPVIRPHFVIERRRALEWLVSEEDWDHVPMDT